MSQYYALQGGTYIPENANLDNYKTPGNYYCDSSALVPTIVNCPSASAFTMKVEYSTGNGYPAQVIRQHDTGDIFYRFFTSYQNRWYPWISYVTNTDLITKFLGSENLNNIKGSGWHCQTHTANATTERNYPIEEAGFLLVTPIIDSSFILQQYTASITNATYKRVYQQGVWRNWQQL